VKLLLKEKTKNILPRTKADKSVETEQQTSEENEQKE
jgi:hypothetical protein